MRGTSDQKVIGWTPVMKQTRIKTHLHWNDHALTRFERDAEELSVASGL